MNNKLTTSVENLHRTGVHDTVSALHEALRSYIESQYHIRNDFLVREREALLNRSGVISQRAYVEATPVYAQVSGFNELQISEHVRNVLTKISDIPGVGIFPKPYSHQAEALNAFLGKDQADLVVATGTGSGKTESFLMPIIGQLALESEERPSSRELPGCRAILLYPMNALVNDQVARIRKLFGKPEVNALIAGQRNRPIRFGSYTGRTPYPGKRDGKSDARYIAPLFEDFYLKVEKQADIKAALKEKGRWPSKDLLGFYGDDGAGGRAKNWNARLVTQPADAELMTRHEMQKQCPDLLVTNYSMLEYMLLRPIEGSIFARTEEWLKADPKNQITLVLDEAHMYRGAGGAEVALLIRRLIARLGIPRSRVRCILTSASLRDGEEGDGEARQFAVDLTGRPSGNGGQFKVIRGKREKRAEGASATVDEVSALAAVNVDAISEFQTNPAGLINEMRQLAEVLGWSTDGLDESGATNWLYKTLTGFGPVELLISTIMGVATSLDDLYGILFPNIDEGTANAALDVLLAMCCIAKRDDGRVLMPARLHLFHRGLPGLFACVDPMCSDRHVIDEGPSALGRFHTKPYVSCGCKSNSRVYEYLTHRDCGTSFIRGWVDDKLNFVWHQPENGRNGSAKGNLYPIEMLVEGEAHPNVVTQQRWLHMATGQLDAVKPINQEGYRSVLIPDKQLSVTKEMTFSQCPVCNKRTVRAAGDTSKIMDHATKGEAPFSALVRTQMDYQPATRQASRRFPNAGRKVLVFSDGRQKAARLARDMPRDVELDVFRQTIASAVKALESIGREATLSDKVLYLAFIDALSRHNLIMFDVESNRLEEQVSEYVKFDDGLAAALVDFTPGSAPNRYKIALLKLICSSFYSVVGTVIGFVEPTKRVFNKISEEIGTDFNAEEIRALCVGWIAELLDDYAFDEEIPPNIRSRAAGPFFRGGSKGVFQKGMRSQLAKQGVTEAQLVKLETVFQKYLARNANGFYILPNQVKVNIDLNKTWFECQTCTSLMPLHFRRTCLSCGMKGVKELDPNTDTYLLARKSYWREPIKRAQSDSVQLTNINAEEHTAQLSNRDRRSVHSTTELHELRFQDVLLEERDRPIDVISCTTTMEVGIDIGSLVSVALRNVPPQRENYQQRAGRAGRRGSSVSSVVTYSQNGPHDGFYFMNPKAMVSGAPRSPELKVNNPKIAERHVRSYLLQTFFQRKGLSGTGSAMLQKALGGTREFFHSEEHDGDNLSEFTKWGTENVLVAPYHLRKIISEWLPSNLNISIPIEQWVEDVVKGFLGALQDKKKTVPKPEGIGDEDEGSDDSVNFDKEDLLEFLFFHALLPSYAFPTSLCSFLVEKREYPKNREEIRVLQMPQQATNQALSEYAPGRLVVINKQTYRSGGVYASGNKDVNRAESIFSNRVSLVMCDACSYIHDPHAKGATPPVDCPVCGSKLQRANIIRPEMFGPEEGKALDEDDRDQEITYATMAQFPQPIGGESFAFTNIGHSLKYAFATDNRLLTLNKGIARNGQSQGFLVCKKCGSASVYDGVAGKTGAHLRPYLLTRNQGNSVCTGEFEQVFLWFDFSTDVLLLRIVIRPPLITDLTSNRTVKTLESAAYSIAEALRLAASRHRQLDIDPSEFGAGHRLLPPAKDGSVTLDVYLYDTLSGGAGYSELAASYFQEIAEDTLAILEGCNCDTSCTECLDHFRNQHLKSYLNRRLAASLLRYTLYNELPNCGDVSMQEKTLSPLLAFLALDGCEANAASINNEMTVAVSKGGTAMTTVKLWPSLLDEPDNAYFYVRENALNMDLPGIHARIRQLAP